MTTKMSKNTRIIKMAFKLSLGIFCLSFMTQFYLSNRCAVKNNNLKDYLTEISLLEKEISQLEYRNFQVSSLERVESEARELGFVEMISNLRVIGPVTVASLNIL